MGFALIIFCDKVFVGDSSVRSVDPHALTILISNTVSAIKNKCPVKICCPGAGVAYCNGCFIIAKASATDSRVFIPPTGTFISSPVFKKDIYWYSVHSRSAESAGIAT